MDAWTDEWSDECMDDSGAHTDARWENNTSQALVWFSSEPSAQSQKLSFNSVGPSDICVGGSNPNTLHSCTVWLLPHAPKLAKEWGVSLFF